MELYLKDGDNDSEDESEGKRKIVHEKVNARWEVAVTVSNKGFQQASFVNSIATTKVRVKCNRIIHILRSFVSWDHLYHGIIHSIRS